MTDLKIYKALNDLLCDSKYFGKHFKNVTIQNVDGENIAVSNTGVDLIPMLPSDTIQEFNYFRPLTDFKLIPLDFGGCSTIKSYNQSVLWVYYNKNQKSIDSVISLLERELNSSVDFIFTPVKMITDQAKLIKSEFPKLKKNLEVKNITYIGIELSITFENYSSSFCNEDECY
jgi:hypothetical protein